MPRPKEANRAKDRLNARAMLTKALPAIDKLRSALREQDVDVEGVSSLLNDALNEVEANSRNMSAVGTVVRAHGDDLVAKAISKFDDRVRRDAGIIALKSGLDRLLNNSQTEQRAALLEVVLAAATDVSRPRYLDIFIDQLQWAGLTNAVQRGLSPKQIDEIRNILGAPKPSRKLKTARTQVVEIEQSTRSPWTQLKDPIHGFKLERRPLKFGDPDDARTMKASLPPMVSIDAFKPGAGIGLASLGTDTEKARFAYRILRDWLKANGASDFNYEPRLWAWTFLLGHVHGFLAGWTTFEQVTFASPWQVNQIVIATRRLPVVSVDGPS